jgi:hypothetical protein
MNKFLKVKSYHQYKGLIFKPSLIVGREKCNQGYFIQPCVCSQRKRCVSDILFPSHPSDKRLTNEETERTASTSHDRKGWSQEPLCEETQQELQETEEGTWGPAGPL